MYFLHRCLVLQVALVLSVGNRELVHQCHCLYDIPCNHCWTNTRSTVLEFFVHLRLSNLGIGVFFTVAQY